MLYVCNLVTEKYYLFKGNHKLLYVWIMLEHIFEKWTVFKSCNFVLGCIEYFIICIKILFTSNSHSYLNVHITFAMYIINDSVMHCYIMIIQISWIQLSQIRLSQESEARLSLRFFCIVPVYLPAIVTSEWTVKSDYLCDFPVYYLYAVWYYIYKLFIARYYYHFTFSCLGLNNVTGSFWKF